MNDSHKSALPIISMARVESLAPPFHQDLYPKGFCDLSSDVKKPSPDELLRYQKLKDDGAGAREVIYWLVSLIRTTLALVVCLLASGLRLHWSRPQELYSRREPNNTMDTSMQLEVRSILYCLNLMLFLLCCGCAGSNVENRLDTIHGPNFVPSNNNVVFLLNETVPLELALIPSGVFMQGSPADTPNRDSYDLPFKEVEVGEFYMGIYEITHRQFGALMEIDYPSELADRPLIDVRWTEANEFCSRLNALSSWRFSLPTETQWEYACHAGTATSYGFGDDQKDLDKYAWFDGNYPPNLDIFWAPNKAGQKMPNRWGLYDMHGNIYEWCEDQWADPGWSKEEASREAAIPRISTLRVIKGGAWRNGASNMRCAHRYYAMQDMPSPHIGFRVTAIPLSSEN